jgi:hypothetical protein
MFMRMMQVGCVGMIVGLRLMVVRMSMGLI